MIEKVIFWSEFPEKVDWKKVKELLESIDLKIDVYVACRSKKEFISWKKKIEGENIEEVGAWPVLDKKNGYWFSGLTSKKNIDELKEYKNLKVKIDLEAPFGGKYNHLKMLWYVLFTLGKKATNKEYLEKTVAWLSKHSEVELIVNEFPFFSYLQKRSGTFIDISKYDNLDKNLMSYTSMAGDFRFFWKRVKNYLLKRAYKKYGDKLMCSVGLIGKGILGNEKVYKNSSQFEEDLDAVNKIGIKRVAIYSIDGIMKRKNPLEWFKVVKKFRTDAGFIYHNLKD